MEREVLGKCQKYYVLILGVVKRGNTLSKDIKDYSSDLKVRCYLHNLGAKKKYYIVLQSIMQMQVKTSNAK